MNEPPCDYINSYLQRLALKKYKKKFEKAKILVQLRDRQSFTKPSVRRRNQVLKAVYKQQIASGKIEG